MTPATMRGPSSLFATVIGAFAARLDTLLCHWSARMDAVSPASRHRLGAWEMLASARAAAVSTERER